MSTQTPATSPDLRPLAIGELIDRSAALWRQNFGAFFRLYIVFQLGVFIVTKGYELYLARFAPLIRGGSQLMQAMQDHVDEVLRQYAIAFAGTVGMSVVTIALSWIVAVIGSHYAARRQLGQPVTLADGLRRTRERFGTLVGALVLSSLWGVVVMVLAALPGGVLMGVGVVGAASSTSDGGAAGSIVLVGLGLVVALFGVLIAVLWYILRFLLTAPVIAVEDGGAWEALKRSGALISGRVGPGLLNLVKVRATVLLTLVIAILAVVGLVAGFPALIVQFAYSNPLDPAHANPDAVPQLLLIPAQLLQVLAQACFSPLYLVFCALFYVDMRVRREGLDLELKLASQQKAA